MRACCDRRSLSVLRVVRDFVGQRVLEHVDHFRPHPCVVNQLGRSATNARRSSSADGSIGDDALEHAARELAPDDGRHAKQVA